MSAKRLSLRHLNGHFYLCIMANEQWLQALVTYFVPIDIRTDCSSNENSRYAKICPTFEEQK
jgi:hypothetical protein